MTINLPKTDYLRIKVIPNSNKNEITEILEDENKEKTYKIRIKAAPEKGKANKELIKFLGKKLNINKKNILIISGKTERIKLLRIKWT